MALDDQIETVEDIVMLGVLAAIAYGLYMVYDYFQNDPAGSSALKDPTGALCVIVGGCQGSTSSGSNNQVAGTLEQDSSGQKYRCNGTQCYPINVDSNGNETVSGVPVPQGSVQNVGASTTPTCAWWDVLC